MTEDMLFDLTGWTGKGAGEGAGAEYELPTFCAALAAML
jgi:hypothetical protein